MASLSLIPFPFALHSLSSSSLAVTHGNTTNQNKNERCHILTLHRFTRFHLEPRMRNIPVFLKVELVPKTISFSFYFFFYKQETDKHTQWMCLSPSDITLSTQVCSDVAQSYLVERHVSSLGDKTTSNRVVKSSPAQGHRKQTLTPSNYNNSVHTAVQTILVPPK